MNYTSIIFLYFFLPLFFGLYAAAGSKRRTFVMSIGSCAVVAWAQPLGLIPLGISVAVGYVFSLIIDKHRKSGVLPKLLLAVCILSQLAQAVIFCALHHRGMELFAAFGCGIYSLNTISICFDVYRAEAAADKNFFNVFAYIGFVPSLCGIPVVRYKTISDQLKSPKIKSDMLANGILLLLYGIAEKVIVSDRLTQIFYEMKATASGNISLIIAWLGALIFACSLYTRLKGYSDIARGFAMMLGFDIGASFRYPFSALTLQEYINSYNISAAGFVREYLHRPIEGRSSGNMRTLIASSVSITVICISYYASARFVIWGVAAALLIILELMFDENLSRIPRPVRYMITHMLTLIGWGFISQDNTQASIDYISNMFAGVMTIDYAPLQYFLTSALPYIALLLLFEIKPLHEHYKRLDDEELSIVTVFKPILTFVLLLLCTVFLMSGAETYAAVGIISGQG